MAGSGGGGTRTLTFVHQYGSDDPTRWGPAIALTPAAAAAQDAHGFRPLVCADFSDRRALLLRPQRDLIGWQLPWLDRLADASGTSRDTVRALFQYLKTPLDSVVASARLWRATIESVNPDAVVYVGPDVDDEVDPWHGTHMGFSPRHGDRPLADRLLPVVCAQLGVPFWCDRVTAASAGAEVPTNDGGRARARLARHYNFVRVGTWRRRGDLSLLLWPAGYGARRVAEVEHASGRRVAVVNRDDTAPSVRLALPLGWRRLTPPIATRLPAPTALDGRLGPAVAEIDTWSTVAGASAALASRVATYVDRLCPTVDRIASELIDPFRRNQVRRVIAANPYTVAEFGGLLAATRLGLDRVLVQHGDHAFPYDFWLAEQTQNFDRLAVSDPTVPADLAEAGARLGCHVPTFEPWAPRLEQLTAGRTRRSPTGSMVGYLPTHYVGDNAQIVGFGFEDAWYFRWQRHLLTVMASLPDVPFLWKALPPASHGADDPMRCLAATVPNVTYETAPFRAVAGRIGSLVTDFASTGFYEARALGIPALAVSFSAFEDIRPRAQAMFDGSIVPCADPDEAEAAIRRFIVSRSRP